MHKGEGKNIDALNSIETLVLEGAITPSEKNALYCDAVQIIIDICSSYPFRKYDMPSNSPNKSRLDDSKIISRIYKTPSFKENVEGIHMRIAKEGRREGDYEAPMTRIQSSYIDRINAFRQYIAMEAYRMSMEGELRTDMQGTMARIFAKEAFDTIMQGRNRPPYLRVI